MDSPRKPSPKRPARRSRPTLEALETRLAPAFNILISGAAEINQNVLHTPDGTFTATGPGATIQAFDILSDLRAGKAVRVNTGAGGGEAGNITWDATFPTPELDIHGIGAGRLTLEVSPSATVGNVTLLARVFDSSPLDADKLDLTVRATGNVRVGAELSVRSGTVELAADTRPDGTGQDGVGTLTVDPGKAISGSSVTLFGANAQLNGPVTATTLLRARTLGDLQVGANLSAGAGTVDLSADVRPDGTGDNGVGALTLSAGRTVTGTAVTLFGAAAQLNGPVTATSLLRARALDDLVVGADLSAGNGTVELSADVRPDGTGHDGVGALAVGAGRTVTGSSVTLFGATAQINGPVTALSLLRARALDDLVVGANVSAGGSTVELSADVRADGTGHDGVGALTVGASGAVTGGPVMLFGANARIDGPVTAISLLRARALDDLVVGADLSAGNGIVELSADVRPDGTGHDGVGALTVGAGKAVVGFSVTLAGPAVELNGPVTTASLRARARVDVGAGIVELSADVGPDGTGHDGVGTLTVAGGGAVTGGQVTLRGADVQVEGPVTTLLSSPAPLNFTNSPNSAFDAEGNLYFTHFPTGTVTRVLRSTLTSSLFASGLSGPRGLAFDAAGNLYVAESTAGRVTRVPPSGTLKFPFAGGFSSPAGLAFDAAGNLYVGDSAVGSISRVTPAGVVSDFLSGVVGVDRLGFDPAGNLYAGPSGQVRIVAQGVVAVRPSLPSLAISAGGTAGVGVNLGNAELARLAGARLVLGGPAQTGDITFSTASLGGGAGVEFVVEQDPAGPGRVVFDRGTGATPALTAPGPVQIQAGGGGVVAGAGTAAPDVGAVSLTLDAAGPIGSPANPLRIASGAGGVVVGSRTPPVGVFLAGLGDLTLGSVRVLAAAPVDVTARGGLTVASAISALGSQVSLAADVRPEGGGDDGAGTLTLGAGVTAGAVTLRGADHGIGSVVSAQSVVVRPSLPALPISVGGTDNAVAGVNLTDVELARLGLVGRVTIGDAAHTGPITFTTATFAAGEVRVEQSATGPGQVLLQGPGSLSAANGVLVLAAGAGGVVAADPGAGVVAGTLRLSTPGPVGSAARPLAARVPVLGASAVGGSVFLAADSLTTTGAVEVGGQLSLSLTGDLDVQPGELRAAVTNLSFIGAGDQRLDTGNAPVHNLIHGGPGTVVLVNNPLVVTGTLINAFGQFDGNGQAVSVAGLTSVLGGVYAAGAGASTFTGGLSVESSFVGGSGPVSAGSVSLGAGAGLVAPTSTLSVSGTWANAGGAFDANGGTVVLTGAGPQRLSGPGQSFRHLIHTGAGVLTVADDVTLTGDFANRAGAGNVDVTNRTVRVGGGWDWGATSKLVSAGSTVVLTGTAQVVSGSTTFNNLTKVVTTADTLTFAAGSTQTVQGALILQGAAGAPLALRSSNPGVQWRINPTGPRTLSFLDVQDSRNLASLALQPVSSHDSGRNTRWTFPTTGQTWTGAVSAAWGDPANWSGGWVPDTHCTVTVPAGAASQPVLGKDAAIDGLVIEPGASLTLAGHGLDVAGAFSNRGTLVLRGDEPVRLGQGNDTTAGTWRYVGGATVPLKDFGAGDYFDLVIDGPGVFRLDAALAVKGSLTVRDGTLDAAGFRATVSGATEVAGGTYLAGANVQTLAGGLTVSAGEFLGSTGRVSAGGVRLTGGLLVAPAVLSVSGDWVHLGGTFDADGGLVDLTGRGQRLLGSTSFFDLRKVVTVADTLTFEAGSTQAVAGTLTLKGASGQLLALRSSAPGSQWAIEATGATVLRFVDVQDGRNDGPAPLTATRSLDSGNNSGWTFA